jgi:hypothetical protein
MMDGTPTGTAGEEGGSIGIDHHSWVDVFDVVLAYNEWLY